MWGAVKGLRPLPTSLLKKTPLFKHYGTVPWYVSEAQKQTPEVQLPELPAQAPNSLKEMAEFAARDLGLVDIQVLDGRNRQSAVGPALMLLGTGKSNRHLGRAAELLLTWLKNNYNVKVSTEGVLSSNLMRTHRRREQRRAQQQRMAGNSDREQLAKIGSWIVVDTKKDNIYVHLLTGERRERLDLETLWIRDAPKEVDTTEFDEQFLDPVQSTTTSTPASTSSTSTTGTTPRSSPRGTRQYHTRRMSTVPVDQNETLVSHIEQVLAEEQPVTLESPVVVSFFENMPALPNREQWKLRLKFIASVCMLSSQFPLEQVLESISLQRAAGFPVDQDDMEMALCAIAYYGQSDFAKKEPTSSAQAEWKQLCDAKSKLVLQLYDATFRVDGNRLFVNDRLVTLLFRMYAGPSATSVDPVSALEDPTPSKRPSIFIDSRLAAIQLILEQSHQLLDGRTLTLVLTTLVNSHTWDTFWRILDNVMTLAAVDSRIIEAAVAMVVKSGNDAQISHALHRFVPTLLLAQKIDLTPTLARTLEAALVIIDPEEKANVSLRRALARNNGQPVL